MRRKDNVSAISRLHVCEDHFNIKEDTVNYIKYKLMKEQGEKVKIFLKKGVMPHKFQCQKRNVPAPQERMYAAKKKRLLLINEALSEPEVNSENVLESETSQTSYFDARPSTSYIEGCENDLVSPSTSVMDVSVIEPRTSHVEVWRTCPMTSRFIRQMRLSVPCQATSNDTDPDSSSEEVVQRPEVSVTSGSGNTSPQRDAAVAQAAETTDDEETRDESPGPEQSETSGNGDTSPQRDATVAHAAETTVEDQIKAFIARVFHYLEQEFEVIKNMDAATVLRHLARLPHRTARATGVSEATVLAIIEEEARRNAAERARREGEAHASAAGSAKTRKRRRVRKKQNLAESGSEVSDGSVDETRPSQASVPQDTTIEPAAELLVMKTEPFEYYNEEPAINIVPANETAMNKEQVQKDPISIDVKVEAPAASDDEMTDTNETSPAKPATSKRRRISRQSDRSDHIYTHDQERIDSDPLSSNVKVEAPDEEMNESSMLSVRLKAERENDEEGFS